MAKLQVMNSPSPLAGLKIVVTRPRDQAVQLVRSIAQAGGEPLLFPLLDIAAVQDTRELNEQISRLAQFDLAIFISPNAVRYGVEAIREVNCELLLPPCRGGERSEGASGMGVEEVRDSHVSTPSLALMELPANRLSPQAGKSLVVPLQGGGNLRIATVGQGSAKALRELGITDIIAPTERFDSEGLLALPELQDVAGWKVMIFRGDGGRELLGDTLKARGATVEYAACYQRSKPQQDASMLLSEKPDAITVTSSEALAYLWQMLDDKARAALRDTALFVPHPRIAELAKQQGWQRVRLTDSGDDGLLSALQEWAEQQAAGKDQA
ncbi:MAG: uroporphyrinogen-III synthase [Nitrosomonadales bacterium]|nr:uroporphyrinogen-III synthase [Nitrosomonadales bacterium]